MWNHCVSDQSDDIFQGSISMIQPKFGNSNPDGQLSIAGNSAEDVNVHQMQQRKCVAMFVRNENETKMRPKQSFQTCFLIPTHQWQCIRCYKKEKNLAFFNCTIRVCLHLNFTRLTLAGCLSKHVQNGLQTKHVRKCDINLTSMYPSKEPNTTILYPSSVTSIRREPNLTQPGSFGRGLSQVSSLVTVVSILGHGHPSIALLFFFGFSAPHDFLCTFFISQHGFRTDISR